MAIKKKTVAGSIAALLISVATVYQSKNLADTQQQIDLNRNDQMLLAIAPDAIPGLTFGVPQLLASVLWLRLTAQIGQWYTRNTFSDQRYEYMALQLNAIARLDPFAIMPYTYATTMLATYGGQFTVAHEIALRALSARSGDWKVYFAIGSLYYSDYGLREKAGEWWKLASLFPDVGPKYLSTLAQFLLLKDTGKMDELLLAFGKDSSQLAAMEKEWVEIREFRSLVARLKNNVYRYRQKYGINPEGAHDMVKAGIWRQIPIDPWGGEVRIGKGGVILPSYRIPLYLTPKEAQAPESYLETGSLPSKWSRSMSGAL